MKLFANHNLKSSQYEVFRFCPVRRSVRSNLATREQGLFI